MLYPKSQSEKLSRQLFAQPPAEYRAAPFWAWNCRLDEATLKEQIDIFERMGMGGFFMHVRTGLETPYMNEDFMRCIRACVEKAKGNRMLAYLYDEDRWPSGAAGGKVTQEEAFRARYLLFTPNPQTEGLFLGAYAVSLDENGCLAEYHAVSEGETAAWYAYRMCEAGRDRFNGNSYVDTLNPRAIERFIEITHERYREEVGADFGGAVPAIFTDEPQFTRKRQLKFAREKMDVWLPWTDDLPETFRAATGLDLLGHLPELIWELPGGQVSEIRYHYHDHVAERFAAAFADTCGKWCAAHNLPLTGHMMEEPTLKSQTCALGEAMRSYRSFGIPGIDMLCDKREYTTAKQCQSAVRQYGREAMLSELDGVTGWDFEFRGHKLQGDWQAALGVTLRVPHLSWMSMAGAAKRDYPASISFQSPWWKEYHAIEDHFARLNTALTRGRPVVRAAVVHPVESYWLHWGPVEQTASAREQLDELFQNVTEWMLLGNVDFDFLCESQLPALCDKGANPLKVGEMAYDAVIVPGCETLRSTTLERLEAFANAGGRLIFIGNAPQYENARPSQRAKALYDRSIRIAASQSALMDAIAPVRLIDIHFNSGERANQYVHQLRRDGSALWLFIAQGKTPYNRDVPMGKDVRIRVKGAFRPTVYDTLTGETRAICHRAENGATEIYARLWDEDSLLLLLEPVEHSCLAESAAPAAQKAVLPVSALARYALDEPNALLLDQAEFAVDDGPWQAREEILRAAEKCFAMLGWPVGDDLQPYAKAPNDPSHTVRFRFSIHSEARFEGLRLAGECLEGAKISLNGESAAASPDGWYVDKCLAAYALPPLQAGENTLLVEMPFGQRTNLEWMYLLGDFAVVLRGRQARLVPREGVIGFGSIAEQGLPFYGGNISYEIPFESQGGEVTLRAAHYRGAAMKIALDGRDLGLLTYAPYEMSLGVLPAGRHTLTIALLGHRGNAFGPVHLADENERWIGPSAWHTTGDRWTYEYRLKPIGLLSAPILMEARAENRP